MDSCRHCEHELMPGFEFCHHCGASIHETEAEVPESKNLVEVVDGWKDAMASSIQTSRAVSEAADRWLGPRASVRRVIASALMTGFTIVMVGGITPFSVGVIHWVESWLFFSLLFLAPITYWITGFIPFVGVFNTALGDLRSLRRRLLISLCWTGVFWVLLLLPGVLIAFFQAQSGEQFLRALNLGSASHLIGAYLVAFYLMGFAFFWRPIDGLERSLFRNEMAEEAPAISARIREHLEGRRIRGLRLAVVEMSKLRRLTAGESHSTRGQQLTLTRGRARMVVFIQAFGDGLFIRWAGFHDASGRRLWVCLGVIVGAFNALAARWTGNNVPRLLHAFWRALSPNSNENMADASGRGLLARFLGLIESISEYGWNELYALEASVVESVIEVVRAAEGGKESEEAFRALIANHTSQENQAVGRSSPGAL